MNAEKKEISVEMFKNTPRLISLMRNIKGYKVDIDNLTNLETRKLISLALIASR